jgi:hypothetical protein
MAKIEIEVPNKIADSSLVESIKNFLHNKYDIPKWEVSVRKIKRAPSLKIKGRKKLSEWKVID